jgi:hypothetical protein
MGNNETFSFNEEGDLPPGTVVVTSESGVNALAHHLEDMWVPETHTVNFVCVPPMPPSLHGVRWVVPGVASPSGVQEEFALRVRVYHKVGAQVREVGFNPPKGGQGGGLSQASTVMFEPDDYGGENESSQVVPVSLIARTPTAWCLGRSPQCELHVAELESLSQFAVFIAFQRGAFTIACVSTSQNIAMLVEEGGKKLWKPVAGPVKVIRGSYFAFCDRVGGNFTGVYLHFA